MMERSALRSFAVGFPRPILAAAAGGVLKSMQSGTLTTAASSTQNITISAVDISKAFAVILPRFGSTSPALAWHTCKLSSTTNLQLQNHSGTGGIVIEWFVIEFTAGITVQQATIVIADGATSNTATITSVDTSRVFLLSTARVDTTDSAYFRQGGTSVKLTNATTLTATKPTSTHAVTVEVFVIAFD